MTAYVLMMLLGLVAGFINALAAGGSALTLPALALLGLRPRVANGTNRIALVVSGVTRLCVFHRAGIVDWRQGFRLLLPTAAGALVGASVAIRLPPHTSAWPIVVSALIEFTLVVTGFSKMVDKSARTDAHVRWSHLPLFALIGVWGGFIAVDSAIFFLWALVVLVGYGLARGNALKALLMMTMSAVSLADFAVHGDVDYVAGALVSSGSIVGSWAGAHFVLNERSKIWIWRLLVFVAPAEIILVILKFA
jgi:uncharacterized membrane protein YfcA